MRSITKDQQGAALADATDALAHALAEVNVARMFTPSRKPVELDRARRLEHLSDELAALHAQCRRMRNAVELEEREERAQLSRLAAHTADENASIKIPEPRAATPRTPPSDGGSR